MTLTAKRDYFKIKLWKFHAKVLFSNVSLCFATEYVYNELFVLPFLFIEGSDYRCFVAFGFRESVDLCRRLSCNAPVLYLFQFSCSGNSLLSRDSKRV